MTNANRDASSSCFRAPGIGYVASRLSSPAEKVGSEVVVRCAAANPHLGPAAGQMSPHFLLLVERMLLRTARLGVSDRDVVDWLWGPPPSAVTSLAFTCTARHVLRIQPK